jgi:hypothetical protein
MCWHDEHWAHNSPNHALTNATNQHLAKGSMSMRAGDDQVNAQLFALAKNRLAGRALDDERRDLDARSAQGFGVFVKFFV